MPVWRGVFIMPVWMGTLVVPAELGWILAPGATDLTSRSLRKANRRGTLVVPAEADPPCLTAKLGVVRLR